MNEKRQADLLEQFMLMLRKDINAEAPHGLDPDTIEFARKLAQQSYLRPENQSSIDRITQARIWHRALSATEANQPEIDLDEENEMLLTQENRKTTPFPLTAIAAVLALVLFGVVIMVATNLNPKDNTASIVPLIEQDESATPVASPTHTHTPASLNGMPTSESMCYFVTISLDSGAYVFGTPNDSDTIITTLESSRTAEALSEIVIDGVSWYEVQTEVNGAQVRGFVSSNLASLTVNDNCALIPNGPLPTLVPVSIDDLIPVGTTLQELEFGTLITADMVTVVYWNPANLPANAIVGGDILNTIVGQYATRYIGAYTALLASDISESRPSAPTPLPAGEVTPFSSLNMLEVVVATQDIPQGEQITADMLELALISGYAVPTESFIGQDGLDSLIGQYTTINITQGRVIVGRYITETEPTSNVDVVEVVTSMQDIPQGTQITANMLQLSLSPVEFTPQGALIGQAGLDWFIGQYARTDIFTGMIIQSNFVIPELVTPTLPVTPSPIFIPSLTHTATLTPTITNTITASATFVPTETVTPTFTVTASPTVVTTATFTPTPASPVQIRTILGAGILEAEAVQFMNNGNTINIGGWTLTDSDGNEFVFPDGRRLFSNASAILYTRAGQGTPVLLYWGLDEAIFERGEIVQLRDDAGALIDTYQVP